jgi:hypothetical protein
VFGTARVHLYAQPGVVSAEDAKDNTIYLENTRGVLFEAAMEARDARLRQARVRYGAALTGQAPSSVGLMGLLDLSGYLEATVFRSAFFSNARIPGTGDTRGTAWGGGAGASVLWHTASFGLLMDFNAALNRPELPDSSHCAEPVRVSQYDLVQRGNGLIRTLSDLLLA